MESEEIATQKTFRSYLFYFSGQIFSILGSSIVQFVIIFWITVETESAVFISIAAFLMFLPQVIITPFAGVISDRWNRKTVIAIIDAQQAFITFILFLMFFFDFTNIWLVLLMYTIRSALIALHWPTFNAIIPAMVPKDKLTRVNGIIFLGWGMIQIIGPVVSATLLAFFPINQIFLIDIITFAIAIVPLLLVEIPKVEKTAPEVEKPSFFADFKIGIKEVIAVPGLIALISSAMINNFFFRPFMVLMPFFVYITHSGTAFDLAFVLSFMSIGNVIGASASMVKKNWKHKIGFQIMAMSIAFSGYFILVVAPLGAFLVIGMSVLIVGMVFPLVNNIYMTILYTAVSKDKVGRIVSIDHTLSMAFIPIGAIIAGPLAEVMGIHNLFIVSGIMGIASCLLIWLFTSIRKLEQMEAIEEPQIEEAISEEITV